MTDEQMRFAWLWTHCRALGMTRKSDSGTFEHDIALFIAELHAKSESPPVPDVAEANRPDKKVSHAKTHSTP
jgi:hypothetical protein